MTVATPITGQTITTAWGTQVATDVNALLGRVGATETEIDALQARVGSFRRVAEQFPSLNGNVYTVPFATVITESGVSYSSGAITVPSAGIYAVSAFVYMTNGQGSISNVWLNVGGSVGKRGHQSMDTRAFTAQWSGYVAASTEISFNLQTVNAGTTGTILDNDGELQVWKVAP